MQTVHPYKAVAIDLDGTLLTTDKRITEYSVKVLQELMNRGIHVIIATGRSLSTTIRFVQQVGTKAPLIIYNGSVIWDPITQTDLYHTTLNHEISSEIVKLAESSPLELHAFMNHQLYFTESGQYADDEEPLSSSVGHIVDFQTLGELNFTKAMFVGNAIHAEEIREHLKKKFDSQVHMVFTHTTFFEIMSGGTTKGSALEKIASNLSLKPSEIIAFGDADNDIEMLQYAGASYAMANATDGAKKGAKYLSNSNDKDGVASTLHDLFNLDV